MTDRIQELLSEVAPGDRFDLDSIAPELRDSFLTEFEGQGMVVNSSGVVGCVEMCPDCDGDGQLKGGRECSACEGFSLVADFGRGMVPYRD